MSFGLYAALANLPDPRKENTPSEELMRVVRQDLNQPEAIPAPRTSHKSDPRMRSEAASILKSLNLI